MIMTIRLGDEERSIDIDMDRLFKSASPATDAYQDYIMSRVGQEATGLILTVHNKP